ncbi:MAG: hypothetical protein KC422_26180 [Trueperaceae bacterium]|nr:hypothetical protein [Trueperaceae bacterium]
MYASRLIFDTSGSKRPIVSPNAWLGQDKCVIGPFSNQTIAEYFAGKRVDFGHYEVVEQTIFARGDSWYVQVDKQTALMG